MPSDQRKMMSDWKEIPREGNEEEVIIDDWSNLYASIIEELLAICLENDE